MSTTAFTTLYREPRAAGAFLLMFLGQRERKAEHEGESSLQRVIAVHGSVRGVRAITFSPSKRCCQQRRGCALLPEQAADTHL